MTEIKKIRTKAAAEHLQLSASTLVKWRMKEEGPPYHRCGPRIVFYYVPELEQWQKDCDQRERDARSHKPAPPQATSHEPTDTSEGREE